MSANDPKDGTPTEVKDGAAEKQQLFLTDSVSPANDKSPPAGDEPRPPMGPGSLTRSETAASTGSGEGPPANAVGMLPVTMLLLTTRLRQCRDSMERALLGPVLRKRAYAEPDASVETTRAIMRIAARSVPTATSELLFELVAPSLTRMHKRHPGSHPNNDQVLAMAEEALREEQVALKRSFERGDQTELAAELLRVHGDSLVHDEGAFFTYRAETGCWEELETAPISRQIQDLAGRPIRRSNRETLRVSSGTVAGTLQLMAARAGKRNFFKESAPGFAFRNGFVTVDSGGLHCVPHSPVHRARTHLGVDFSETAPAPRFLAYLAEVFAGDSDAAAKTALLQEFVGACLVGAATKLAKALVLLGGGRNGKSTLLKIVSALFPSDARAAVAPQSLHREFYRAQLVGVRLNIVAELPQQSILSSEQFKAVVAGDEISARHIRAAPFNFAPIAGHLLAANTLPPVDDQTQAFWTRVLVVRFNRTFKDEEQDRDLADNVINSELSGVALWALAGAARIVAQANSARYTVPTSHTEALAEWRRSSDPVQQFVEEMIERSDSSEERTDGRGLYNAFCDWAKERGYRKVASNLFGARLKAIGIAHVKPHSQILYKVRLKSDPARPTGEGGVMVAPGSANSPGGANA